MSAQGIYILRLAFSQMDTIMSAYARNMIIHLIPGFSPDKETFLSPGLYLRRLKHRVASTIRVFVKVENTDDPNRHNIINET